MKHTKETKKKLSEMRKGSLNPFFGKHHSEEFKRRLSERTKIQNSKRQYDLQPRKIRDIENSDLHYLAGFCDADGSIRFTNPKGKPRPFIAFYNTNKDVIQWIHKKLGHTSIQYQNIGRELVQSARIDSARDVYFLAKQLLPFLIVKKDDAIAVIKFLEAKYGDRIKT